MQKLVQIMYWGVEREKLVRDWPSVDVLTSLGSLETRQADAVALWIGRRELKNNASLRNLQQFCTKENFFIKKSKQK